MTQLERDGVNIGAMRVGIELIEAATRVRNSTPEVLESLALAVRRQADLSARSLVTTTPDTFQAAQGRAQALFALADLLAAPHTYFNQFPRR